MLFSRVSMHFRHRAELLLRDRVETLARSYVYPLPVFIEGRRLIVQTPAQAQQILSHVRTTLVERGIIALCPRISAMDLPRAGRFRVWVDWRPVADPTVGTPLSSVIYYCRETPEGIVTEMADYTHVVLPGLNRQIEALALIA